MSAAVVSRPAMVRLFAAIAIPETIKDALLGLAMGMPGARWLERDSLHLTLRFIGEVDGAVSSDVRESLASIDQAGFSLTLSGVGQFGDRKPHTLWAGVMSSEPLVRLAAKIEQVLQRIGLPAETRKFTPHISLARLKASSRERVGLFLAGNSLFRAGPFTVNAFALYSSHLGRTGAHYRTEQLYPLRSV